MRPLLKVRHKPTPERLLESQATDSNTSVFFLKKKNLISGNLEKKSNFLLTSLNSCKEKFICRIPWVFGLAFKEPGSNTS